MKLDTLSVCAITVMHVVVALPAHAQRYLDTLPASAYARAERFMQHRAADKMYRNRVDVRWLADGSRFWYAVETPDGTDRYIVDPVREMLVDCSASPGKNPPGSVDCQADPVCCTTQS